MALREILAEFGFRVDDAGLKKANAGVTEFAKSLGNIKGLVGGVLTGLGLGFLKHEVDDLAAEAGAVSKASIKAGVDLHDFERIAYQTGLGTDQLTGLFRKLQQNMAAAGGQADKASTDFQDADGGIGQALGSKKALETFKSLGVELSDASGKAKGNGEVFQDVAQALAKLPDPAQRTALAIRIFGRSGSDILPFLQKSPEAIAKLGEQFDLIGGFTDDSVKTLKEYTKQNKALELASKSLKIALVTQLVPAITFVYEKVNNAIGWFKKNADTSNLLKIAVIGLAGGFALLNAGAIASAASVALAWARVLFPIALIYLLLDDVIHFLAGDAKSATEDFILALFGIDQGSDIIAELRAGFYLWTIELDQASGTLERIKVFLEGILSVGEKITNLAWVKILGKEGAAFLKDPLHAALPNEHRSKQVDATTQAQDDKFLADMRKGPTLKGSDVLPGFAPLAPAPVKPAVQTIDAKQTINVTQHIEGADAKEIADKANEGIGGAVKSSGQATFVALVAKK